jgi:hypothetical protein
MRVTAIPCGPKTLIPAQMGIESDSAAPDGTLDHVDRPCRRIVEKAAKPSFSLAETDRTRRVIRGNTVSCNRKVTPTIGNGGAAGNGVEDRKQRRQ